MTEGWWKGKTNASHFIICKIKLLNYLYGTHAFNLVCDLLLNQKLLHYPKLKKHEEFNFCKLGKYYISYTKFLIGHCL